MLYLDGHIVGWFLVVVRRSTLEKTVNWVGPSRNLSISMRDLWHPAPILSLV